MMLPDGFLEKLSKLGERSDDITKEVLKAGGEAALDKVRDSLDAVIGHDLKSDPRSTGELQSALGVSRPLSDRNGNFNVKVGFSENRSDGKSNAMLANIIEYGKHGQPAKPFLARAKRVLKKPVQQAMIDKFNEEVEKL